MIDQKISDNQMEKIFECFWMFKTTKETAESAGISCETVSNFWSEGVLKKYYELESLPENIYIVSVFDNVKPVSLSKIYQKAREIYGKSVTKHKLTNQLNILTDLGVCGKIENERDTKYFYRKRIR